MKNYKIKYIILMAAIFVTPIIAMQKEDTKIKIDPIAINTVITDITNTILESKAEPSISDDKITSEISNVKDSATNLALKDLLDKTKKNEASLRKKNSCLVVTTGIVSLVSPILIVVCTSGGTALFERVFDLFGTNCTCY